MVHFQKKRLLSTPLNNCKNIISFLAVTVTKRHLILKESIGTMTMEDEALQSDDFEEVSFYDNCYNFFLRDYST